MYLNVAVLFLGGRTKTALLALQDALLLNYQEHHEMFKFAPELKQSGMISELIARYAP